MRRFPAWEAGLAAAALIALVTAWLLSGTPQQGKRSREPQAPVLSVCVPTDAAQRWPLTQLYERETLKTLEQRLGCRIDVVNVMSSASEESFSALLPEGFQGVLFFPDPLKMVSMIEQGMLHEFTAQEMARPAFCGSVEEQIAGRYHGRQFGVIFSEPDRVQANYILAVNADLLEAAGIAHLPADPEALREMLTALQAPGFSPIAVYGSPAGPGFEPLLNLFCLFGGGAHEFRLQESRVDFSKISDPGERYLKYCRSLCTEGLFPEDFLSLSEYAALDMIASGRCAMMVFTEEVRYEQAKAQAFENGIRIQKARFPDSSGRGQPHVYNRLTGAVTAGEDKISEALALFDFLQQAENPDAVVFKEEELGYPLFLAGLPCPSPIDPVLECRYNIRLLHSKHKLDQLAIDPYYSRIVIGELPIASFSQMRGEWLESGGDELLELYTRYYHNGLFNLGVT